MKLFLLFMISSSSLFFFSDASPRNSEVVRLLDDEAAASGRSSAGAEGVGLYPKVFNLAPLANFEANATCGEDGAEYYCRLVSTVYLVPCERVFIITQR
jgi:hypothetical protein